MDCDAQIIFNALPQCLSSHCVVPEGIHTPPPLSGGQGKFQGEGGIRGGGVLLTKLFFQGV